MTLEQLLQIATNRLLDAGYIHGEREAVILVGNLLDKDTAWLVAHPQETVSAGVVDKIDEQIEERIAGKPLAYILGQQQFLGWNFIADERALIPRPETEQLTELLVREIARRHLERGEFLEIGTGAGPIAISLKKYFPDSKVTATDISAEALTLAEINAQNLGVEIEFIESNLFKSIAEKKYDLIVANLPYVPSPRLAFVSEQILDYEPIIAIDAGNDGLKYIGPFLAALKPYLKEDGLVAIEMWHTHGEPVRELVAKHLPDYQIEVVRDLADFDRFAVIKKD